MDKDELSPEWAVAVASLTRLIDLMGAELVVGRHREDIDQFMAAVRSKLYVEASGYWPSEIAKGNALARQLIEPVLLGLRLRVKAQRAAERANPPKIRLSGPRLSD